MLFYTGLDAGLQYRLGKSDLKQLGSRKYGHFLASKQADILN